MTPPYLSLFPERYYTSPSRSVDYVTQPLDVLPQSAIMRVVRHLFGGAAQLGRLAPLFSHLNQIKKRAGELLAGRPELS